MRLQLLDTTSPHHLDLLKSLYGLLMLLPQSQAYKTLSERLSAVSALQLHLSGMSSGADKQGKGKKGNGDKGEKGEKGRREEGKGFTCILR